MKETALSSREVHVSITPYNANKAVSALLADAAELSRQQLKQAMHKGAVWLTHARHTRRLRRDKAKLAAGDELHLYYNPELLAQEPPPARLIADEGDYSVWDKPRGMLSQGSKWSDHTTITRWAELQLQPQRPVFLVHRLDRHAHGLILLAHSKGMARQLAALFEQREIDKRYRVTVHGKFPEGDQPMRLDQPLDDKPAVSLAKRLRWDAEADQSVLEVCIETGRKHQIRRHLALAGFPVLGDRLHGPDKDGDLQLAAFSLAFNNPATGEPKSYTLEPQAKAERLS